MTSRFSPANQRAWNFARLPKFSEHHKWIWNWLLSHLFFKTKLLKGLNPWTSFNFQKAKPCFCSISRLRQKILGKKKIDRFVFPRQVPYWPNFETRMNLFRNKIFFSTKMTKIIYVILIFCSIFICKIDLTFMFIFFSVLSEIWFFWNVTAKKEDHYHEGACRTIGTILCSDSWWKCQ